MIDIISDKEKLIKSLQELEFEFAQGNLSKSAYNSEKRELMSRLETLEVADRVKRLQGKGKAEKPLDYWVDKRKEEEAKEAKEELMKKYITASSEAYNTANTNKGVKKSKAILTAVLALIFFTGIGFGIFLMKVPAEASAVPMMVNQSAFPVLNNTNVTNTTTSTNITQTTSTQTDTGGSTGGDTGGSTGGNTGGDTGGNTGGNTGGSTGGTGTTG